MPNCSPFRVPSPLLATSGTPKFNSTLIGSSLYTMPTPAETDGLLRLAISVSCTVLLLSSASSRPAFRKPCSLTGQWGFCGMSVMRLRPADQKRSPPRESAANSRHQSLSKIIRIIVLTTISRSQAVSPEGSYANGSAKLEPIGKRYRPIVRWP